MVSSQNANFICIITFALRTVPTFLGRKRSAHHARHDLFNLHTLARVGINVINE